MSDNTISRNRRETVMNASIKALLDEARVALSTADSSIKAVERILAGQEQIQHPVTSSSRAEEIRSAIREAEADPDPRFVTPDTILPREA